MNHKSIFTVTNEDLGRLNLTKALLFFRELLWADARRIGIAISKVNVSTRTNVPDGGVDATVAAGSLVTHSDIIAPGINTKVQRRKDKLGYEINFNRYFYRYTPPRSLNEIADEMLALDRKSAGLLNEVLGL